MGQMQQLCQTSNCNNPVYIAKPWISAHTPFKGKGHFLIRTFLSEGDREQSFSALFQQDKIKYYQEMFQARHSKTSTASYQLFALDFFACIVRCSAGQFGRVLVSGRSLCRFWRWTNGENLMVSQTWVISWISNNFNTSFCHFLRMKTGLHEITFFHIFSCPSWIYALCN